MLYNSIDVISRRYANDEIYYKISSFDMNMIAESDINSWVNMDEDSLGVGEEYPVEIAIMNNKEFKFHPQCAAGRVLIKNEFAILRSKMPYTDQVVGSKAQLSTV